ncbi:MAG TPA: hypothetical protein VGF23_26130 [Gaiellaceae bacterium]
MGNATEIELLRAVFARQGVEPEDADLEGVAAFVATIGPALAELEQRIPPQTPPLP